MALPEVVIKDFQSVLKEARAGVSKLPAFQRKWKWSSKQVMSLYDSLKSGYPIGSFLFMSSPDVEKLAPRAFHGAGKTAVDNESIEYLVLDGQQRITAGIALYHGLDNADGNEFYIDVEKVNLLAKKAKLNLSDKDAVADFCDDLEIDSGYMVVKKKRADRAFHFKKSKLLWTPFLTSEYDDELNELVDKIKDKRTKDIIRKIVLRHLKPNVRIQVPVIDLGNEFDLSAVSRVFSTINTTGKVLTSFELVVAMLFPSDILLEDDIEEFKQVYPFYKNMDKNGEILLQTIALLDGRSPKKSDLPTNINSANYDQHSLEAAEQLNELGKFLTETLGVGLSITGKFVPYDAILSPMALVYHHIQTSGKTAQQKAKALARLRTWWVGAAIGQQYQEGVHNKQKNDVKEMIAWVDKGNKHKPDWLSSVYIGPSLKSASPTGAMGKLLVSVLNAKAPSDPVTDSTIGYFDGAPDTQVHHIFPTKWAPTGLKGFSKETCKINLALNLMLLSTTTNSQWLNFDPADQLGSSEEAIGKSNSDTKFSDQLVGEDSRKFMRKKSKKVSDYSKFIDARYEAVSDYLSKTYDLPIATAAADTESVDLDDPAIGN